MRSVFKIVGIMCLGGVLQVNAEIGKELDWGYQGKHGPQHWGGLDEAYHLCQQGSKQSPIELADAYKSRHAASKDDFQPAVPQSFTYGFTGLDLVNNGYTLKLNYREGSYVMIKGQRYALQQVHFHTPSEHQSHGRKFAAEMHLVHQNSAGELAVFGVFFRRGLRMNKTLQRILDHAPSQEVGATKNEKVLLNVSDMMPVSRNHAHYQGSLTTPPCSENVRWYVLNQPVRISAEQIEHLQSLMGENDRPVQPLNDRVIYESWF
jgi:carbonic anhydrase